MCYNTRMDDDYDLDDLYGDELEDVDEGEEDDGDELDDYAIEEAGSLDGEQEEYLGMADYSNYGAGVNLDDLTDEQRDLYDSAYHSGKE